MIRGALRDAFRVLKFISRGKSTRNEQERIDTQLLNDNLIFWKNWKEYQAANPQVQFKSLPDDVTSKFYQNVSLINKPYQVLRSENIDILDYQLYHLFKHAQSTGGINPHPKPVYKKHATNPQDSSIEAYINMRIPASIVQIFKPGIEFDHPEGFKLQVKKSKIDHPESGYGVYVAGTIPPGTVIGLYPGTIYYHDTLNDRVLQDNDYLISRFDDTVIDGRSWGRKYEIEAKKNQQLGHVNVQSAIPKKFINQFGIGQYINHPPPEKPPNVFAYSYDFPSSFPTELQEYIPYEFNETPGFFVKRSGSIFPSLLIVSKERISNQELWLNYRFNPSHPYPDWYSQPNVEEATRRWGSVKLL